jgi:hypothetical protein
MSHPLSDYESSDGLTRYRTKHSKKHPKAKPKEGHKWISSCGEIARQK